MTARVALVEPAEAPILARPFFAAAGELSPIVRALAQVPELVAPAMAFLAVALGAGGLDLRTKELIVLRVSARADCTYCVGAHRVVAADVGVDAGEAAALLGRRPLADAFAPAEVELLSLCDAVADGGDVPADLVAAVRRRLGDHGLVEVVVAATTTLMLNRLCTTLQLPLTTATAARLERLDAEPA